MRFILNNTEYFSGIILWPFSVALAMIYGSLEVLEKPLKFGKSVHKF